MSASATALTKQINEESDPKKKFALTRQLESLERKERTTGLATRLVSGLLDETANELRAKAAGAAAAPAS